MNDGGYSTMMDAILFLTLVGASVVILGPVIAGHATERSMADRGLREAAGDVLSSLESEQVDYFEYRILGDVADRIATMGGLNATGDILYKDVTRALLGRGDRHMTAMDIAAGDAASQFSIRYGDEAVRMNPVTAEYDRAASALIDRAVRSMLDSRYGYEFTLRWTPFAGIPLEGEARAGGRHPAGSASASMPVTMPYATNITRAFLERANEPDLEKFNSLIDDYQAGGDTTSLREGARQAIDRCLRNSTTVMVGEIWNNTMGSFVSRDLRLDPVHALGRFTNHETPDLSSLVSLNMSWTGVVESLAALYYGGEADQLADAVARGVADGSMDRGDARRMVLDWLKSRYQPSRAVATVSVWMEPYA